MAFLVNRALSVIDSQDSWSPRAKALGPSTDGLVEKIKILVVEDQAIIRISTAQMLEEAGYGVFEAPNADAAIQILEARNNIRVVFTDIKMPGTTCGLQLARAIRDRWPPIHLIVTSGLNAPAETTFLMNGRFIRKPYAPEHLLRALDELLGPSPAPYRYLRNIKQDYGKVV